MQITSAERLVQFRNLLQSELFPVLESVVGRLGKQSRLLAAIVSLEPLARWVGRRRCYTGRRPCDRRCLATAFFAKAVYNLPAPRHLIQPLQTETQLRRLCGWDTARQVPAEAAFSCAFAELATGLPAQIHQALVREIQQDGVIECLARDSTAIEARQRLPADKDQTPPPSKPPAHRPYQTKSGFHQRGPRLQRQPHMNLSEMLADLPRECSLGVKKSSKGHRQYWRSFELHWDVAEAARIPSTASSPAPPCTIRRPPSR